MRNVIVSFTLMLCAALSLGGCFSPQKPVCAFSCGPGGMCPTDYTCQSDGYCHRNGSTEMCDYPDAGGADISVPDLTPAPDLAGTD